MKSACDRIGATMKRLLTKGSLQRPYTDPIPSSEAIMEFCNKYNPGIHFLPEDIAKHGMKYNGGIKSLRRSREHSNLTD